uniref:Coiled-coil domain-containing protein 22 homolog n=1 Tax=Parascaris univalens TaxID=6257 RepID=A0A914ZM26_PARUN
MAMDLVDRLIVDTLLRLDESFFDGFPCPPKSINELNVEQLYSAIVLLVWSCDPPSRSIVPSRNLPQSMAARYRAAADVVEAIKGIGVRDEIGYQTLLYGQAKELRNVMIGLIEKLPKECPVIMTTKDARTTLLESVANSLRADKTWIALNKYFFPSNLLWKPSWGAPRRISFSGFNGDVSAAVRFVDWRSRGRSILCACLEANARAYTTCLCSNERSLQVLEEAVQSEPRPLGSRPPKPPLPAKPKPSVPPKPVDLVRKGAEKAEESKEITETTSQLNAIIEEVQAVRTAIEMRADELAQKRRENNDCANCLEELRSQESNSGIDACIKQLLLEPKTVNTLHKYIEESEGRMESLQNRWISVKSEKDDELRRARNEYDSMGQEKELQRETAEVLRLADAIESDLYVKHEHLSKLKREVERMEQVQLNRSAYTRRIFEIVANIRKQQEEIDKVLSENRYIQKELKSLGGKLDRTFTVVEEKLYRDVQRDTSMQKAYRLLVKIHEECSWVVSATEACGRINREIDELNDQIAIQQQKRLDEALEKVLNDCMEVKQENDALMNTLGTT